MEYIKIENGQIAGHFCARELPEGKEFKEVTNFNSYVGIDVKAIDFENGGCLKAVDVLISLGIVKDNRGVYYHKKTKLEFEIKELDIEIPKNFTKLKPKQFDKWDGSKWVEDFVMKAEYADALLRGKRSVEFSMFDKYQLPLLWNGLSTKEQHEYLIWRDKWLDAPETGVRPERLSWFQT